MKKIHIFSNFLLFIAPLAFVLSIGISNAQAETFAVDCQDYKNDPNGCTLNGAPSELVASYIRLIDAINDCTVVAGDATATVSCDLQGTIQKFNCDRLDGDTWNCYFPDQVTQVTLASCTIVQNTAACNVTTQNESLFAKALALGITAPQQSIADVLTTVCTRQNISPSMQRDCLDFTALLNADDATAKTILEQVTPDGASAPADMSTNSVAQQTRNIGLRQSQLRSGDKTGISASSIKVIAHGQVLPEQWQYEQYLRGGGASADEGATQFGNMGVFVNGTAVVGDKESTSNELGFGLSSYELTGGVDYRFNPQVFAGMGMGLSKSSADMNRGRGSLDTSGYNLILYGGFYPTQELFMDANITLGGSTFDQKRNIRYTTPVQTVNQTASADFFGQQFSSSLSAGYNFVAGSLTMAPYLQAQYMRSDVDDYREEMSDNTAPGSGWALSIQGQDVDSMTLSAGGQFTLALKQSWGVLIPQARLEWVTEFNDSQQVLKGHFIGDPNKETFRVPNDSVDTGYGNFGLGTTAVLPQGQTFYLYYQTLLGFENVTNHSFNFGARWEF